MIPNRGGCATVFSTLNGAFERLFGSNRCVPLLLVLLCTYTYVISQTGDKGAQLPPWEVGMMDIHHINTGRGDAAFFRLPDGTTLLVDAGDMSETHPRTLSARNAELRPNRSKTAPQWIVDYIEQFTPKTEAPKLDYAIITHYHDDHFGEMDANREKAPEGDYFLTGITEVGSHIPIGMLLDRGSEYPIDLKNIGVQRDLSKDDPYGMISTLKNYWKFNEYHEGKNNLVHDTFTSGALNQIKLLRSPQDFPDFSVRNIAVNGHIWTGDGSTTFPMFSKGEYPGENALSTCIKISYGKFNYFTGGDISGVDAFGESNLHSVESNVAPVIGTVDVATLNHHGNRDSQNSFYVRTLRPRVWIQQNWSSDHPGDEVLRRIGSTRLYPGDRDIFSTVMLQPNKDVIGSRLDSYKSQEGHIVVRVYESGDRYDVFVLDDTSEQRPIKHKFGPYSSR